MFGILKLCEEVESALLSFENESGLDGPGHVLGVDTEAIKAITKLEKQVCALKDRMYHAYDKGSYWAIDGYLSSQAAMVHETGKLRRNVSLSLARGKLVNDFVELADAVTNPDSTITVDHLDLLARINVEKYSSHLTRDIALLTKNAKNLCALQFSHVLRYWRSIVDDEIDGESQTQQNFEARKLFLSQTLNGNWVIQGELDEITGKLVSKALEDIIEKIWRDITPEQRNESSHAQRRADAIGYLAQGYVTQSHTADAPTAESTFTFNAKAALNADVIVDVEALNSSQSTQDFLKQCINRKTPLANTHSPTTLKQVLCDTNLSMPLKHVDGTIDLGRRVRIAPQKLKRQLALDHDHCSIPGCSVPASWCDAHHLTHWVDGGTTTIDNLVLLCRRHHTLIHNDKTFKTKIADKLARKTPELIDTS